MQQYLRIPGRQKTRGSIKINGAKNAAVAIIPASLLTGSVVKLDNLPDITDIHRLIEILTVLGAKISVTSETSMDLDLSGINSSVPPPGLVNQLRASYYLMGSLLGRFRKVDIPLPGGCHLGPRPIDQHVKGFSALGATVEFDNDFVKLRADKLVGAHIYFDVVSVGATVNTMLAAVLAEGKTVLENAAKEPEIVDIANFLNAMGASVRGAGTDVIKIEGVKELYGAEHIVIPDRIEAGTFMLAAAVTGGEVLIKDIIPKHLDSIIAKLKEVGVELEIGLDWVLVKGSDNLQPSDVKTFPYPGFPTDLQPQMMVLLARAKGTSQITENVFEKRFQHVHELRKMGARIKLEGRSAIIEGGYNLTGARLQAEDLRGGASFIIAALASEGVTEIRGVEHIDRGYEKIEERFATLGVHIDRITGDQ